jgi:hypothetical protein
MPFGWLFRSYLGPVTLGLKDKAVRFPPIRGALPMASEAEGSVSLWIGSLKQGDLAAAQPLWERYYG